MNFPVCVRRAGDLVIKNSPKILTGCAVTGVVGTAIFAAKATPKAQIVLEEAQKAYSEEHPNEKFPVFEAVKTVLPVYLPAICMGGVTIGCIIGATTIISKRNAVLASLYSASELALKNYQEKVIETIGEKKEHEVREAIAKDEMRSNPASMAEIIDTRRGPSLCYDELSGRYFYSDIDFIRRCADRVNRGIISDMWASLNEFYCELGLDSIDLGKDVGWNVDHMMKLGFTTQLSDDDRPCLVVQYYNRPIRCDK